MTRAVRVGVAALLISIFVATLVLIGCTGETAPRQEHDAVTAWTMCQQFVEDRLRAPSTADWPWGYSQYTTDLSGGRYQIKTYVDAQNAFGGTVRTNVDCTVEYAGDDRWTLVSLDLN